MEAFNIHRYLQISKSLISHQSRYCRLSRRFSVAPGQDVQTRPQRHSKRPFQKYQHPIQKQNQSEDLEIIMIGTSAEISSNGRSLHSLAIRYNENYLLFDCGEGTLNNLLHSPIKMNQLNKIFISQLHPNTVSGIVNVLISLNRFSFTKDNPVEIYGPDGLRNYLEVSILLLNQSFTLPPYVIHELKNVQHLHTSSYQPAMSFDFQLEGKDIHADERGVYEVCKTDTFVIQASAVAHRIPSLGYVFQEKTKYGALKSDLLNPIIEKQKEEIEKYMTQGKPARHIYKILQTFSIDETFCFPDGTKMMASEFREEDTPGRKIVIMGDNCDGSNIKPIAMDADVLIHEATLAYLPRYFADLQKTTSEKLNEKIGQKGHSTAEMAGIFAKEIKAKKLILSHFSNRYPSDRKFKLMGDVSNIAASFAELPKEKVITASDLMRIKVTK